MDVIHYFPSGDRSPATSWKARPQHPQWLLGKTNTITMTFSLPSPELLLLRTTSYCMEHTFCLLVSAVLAVSPSSFLPIPSLLAGGAEWKKGKTLTLSKHCSAVAEIPSYYQHRFSQNLEQRTVWAAMQQIISIPDRPCTGFQLKGSPVNLFLCQLSVCV